jgi:transcription elongation factor Elf1
MSMTQGPVHSGEYVEPGKMGSGSFGTPKKSSKSKHELKCPKCGKVLLSVGQGVNMNIVGTTFTCKDCGEKVTVDAKFGKYRK